MSTITQEQIAQRAYTIYLRNGSQNGRDMENWLQAEAELKKETEVRPAKACAVAPTPAPAAAPTAQTVVTQPASTWKAPAKPINLPRKRKV